MPTNEGKNQVVKKEGRVIEALPNAFFKVELPDGKQILGFLSIERENQELALNLLTVLWS